MPETHARRRAALADHLRQHDLDAALITSLVNVHYLTGLDSSNAAVLVRADDTATLATDGRYQTAAQTVAPDVERVLGRAVGPVLAATASATPRLAIEEHVVTLQLAASIEAAAEEAGAGVRLSHLGQAVEAIRLVKDEDEIALLRSACAVSCAALESLFEAGGLLGRTEQSIARDLEWRMFERGADGIAFETIVAAGPNSAVPHHRPTDRVVAAGDLVKIDFGAVVGGYHADCTRTVVVGAEPAAWQREIYDLVAVSQRLGSAAVVAGGDAIGVDEAARTHLVDAGYGEAFSHGTGHGVGLEVHEGPTLGYSATGTLADRMTVTVEPGIYLPGRGGVRIEDTLVVRGTTPELLTPTTKDLLVLDT